MRVAFQKILSLVLLLLSGGLAAPLANADQALSQQHASILDFAIGRNTLWEVQNKLGAVAAFKFKSYAPQRICYRSSHDTSALVFEAGPSGDWEVLTAFIVVADVATLPYAKSCAASDAIDAKLQTPGGLKLGLTKAEVEKLLGPPTVGKDGKPGYQFSTQKKVSERAVQEAHADLPQAGVLDKPYLVVMSGVDLVYAGEKISSFTVYKVDTW